MADSADRRSLRASDADRQRVADLLHRAASEGRLSLDELSERLDEAYQAKTYGDLEPVLRELPAPGFGELAVASPAATPAVAPDALPTRRSTRPRRTGVSVGLFSGPSRRGDWLVPPRYVAVAVMGGVNLDLREARFASGHTTIHAYALMGGVDVIVPEWLDVQVDGVGLMGGYEEPAEGPVSTPDAPPDRPTVRVVGLGVMGAVTVKRKPPRKRKRHRDD